MTKGHRVKVWRDADKNWRWTHWSSSDRVATAGEAYTDKQHTLDMVAELFPGVPVEVVEGDDE